jgi:hypothetical protein
MGRDAPLLRLRTTLATDGLAALLLAVISGTAVVAVFEWDVKDMALGLPLGVAVWGGVKFLAETREHLPRGALPEAPAAHVAAPPRPGFARRTIWFLASIPFLVVLAWLADAWSLGAVFVPGQLAGYAAAYAFGFYLVARWERRHRQVVLHAETDDGDPVLYAATPERESPNKETARRGGRAVSREG